MCLFQRILSYYPNSATTKCIFQKKKEKKESPKFIMEDFKKQVYDEKYDLQGGDFLAYPLDLNLSF